MTVAEFIADFIKKKKSKIFLCLQDMERCT